MKVETALIYLKLSTKYTNEPEYDSASTGQLNQLYISEL